MDIIANSARCGKTILMQHEAEKLEKEAKNVCVVDKELLDKERLGAKGPLDEILKKYSWRNLMVLTDYMGDMEIVQFLNRMYDEKGFDGIVEMLKSEISNYGKVKEHDNGLYEFITGGWSDNEYLLGMLNHPLSKFSKHYVGWLRGGSWGFAENYDGYRFDVVAKKWGEEKR